MTIVRRGLLALVGLALIAIWGASAAANFAHGVQLAGHSPYWWVFGLASASMDVIKATALVALVAAYRKRAAAAILACCLAWMVTTGWGIRSCLGFAATTFSDTVSERGMHTVADKSLERQILSQEGQITKLQDNKLKLPAKEWDRVEAEIGRTEERLERLRARVRTTQTVGAADPVADLLAPWIDPRTMRLSTSILFLLGIEVCASLGLVAFMPLFGGRHGEMAEQLSSDIVPANPASTPNSRITGGSGDNKKRSGNKARASPSSPLRAQTAELISQLEGRYGEGASILQAAVFGIYVDLARQRKWSKMASWKLGQQLMCLGVTKEEGDDGRTLYVLPTERERDHKQRRTEGLPAA